MKRTLSLFAAALLVFVPMADMADAKEKHKNKVKAKNGHAEFSIKSKPGKVKIKVKGLELTTNCPPGLAKKNPPCIPPGLVRTAPETHEYDRDHNYDADHDHDVIVNRTTTTYDVDTAYTETNIHQITQVTTIEGDVIYVGDIIVDPTNRYPRLEPTVFGLPVVPEDHLYLRIGDAAVQVDPATQRVLTILALADVLIE